MLIIKNCSSIKYAGVNLYNRLQKRSVFKYNISNRSTFNSQIWWIIISLKKAYFSQSSPWDIFQWNINTWFPGYQQIRSELSRPFQPQGAHHRIYASRRRKWLPGHQERARFHQDGLCQDTSPWWGVCGCCCCCHGNSVEFNRDSEMICGGFPSEM